MRIGLISDTHGLLRASALEALRGSEHIIHGGDIGEASLLEALAALAPLTVVRGNNDSAPWAQSLPEEARLELAGIRVLVLHDLKMLSAESRRWQPQVMISGHSHQPAVREAEGVLYVNPGSAGPRRFRLPVTVAELLISGEQVQAHIIALPP
ncbi:MAG: metallophosphoesterase family protein [Steroidobacteraceae bacterium]|jgi:putative phosphoesterase